MLCLEVLTGCAPLVPSPIPTADQAHWIGRLALQIDEQEAQSFSASFELKGSPSKGELVLFSPLGNVLAHLQWAPGRAVLVTGNDTRTSDSLDALLQQSSGTQLPVAALFDWLDGTASTADGWQADLSRMDEGRLTAVRHTPVPRATLRIALDR
jgi:outer membrane lipoprotein LolB